MKHLHLSTLALAMALAIHAPIPAPSAEPAAKETEASLMKHCEKMKDLKAQMKADMKTQDAELIEHAARMNRAPADQKVDELATLVTHMLEQRIAMAARKASMEEEMMAHMMEHMEMGKGSMAKCPMMKERHSPSAQADPERSDTKN
jgi:hypothetical protein